MERKSFSKMDCSIAQCLEVVGEWWTMLIIRDAFLGVTRFDAFQERLGIARNILQQRLQKPWVRLSSCARYLHPVARQYCAIAAGPRLAVL